MAANWPVQNIEDDDIVVDVKCETQFWPHVKICPWDIKYFSRQAVKGKFAFFDWPTIVIGPAGDM
jgi:hypothetical protein